jgi:hypothetical protein
LTFLESTVDGLRLRTGPGVDAPGFVFPCNPTGCTEPVVINAGWRALAMAGPVAADAYDWYLVKLDEADRGSAHLGWAATPQAADPWLVTAEYECPAEKVDLDTAVSLGAVALLYCYGAEPLTLDGYVVKGFGCGGTGTFEPLWLAHPCANMSYISPVGSTDGDGRLFLHYPASGVVNPTLELDAGQRVRIVGHFDDPASRTCTIMPDEEANSEPNLGTSAVDEAADVAQCRLRFVVTDVIVEPTN